MLTQIKNNKGLISLGTVALILIILLIILGGNSTLRSSSLDLLHIPSSQQTPEPSASPQVHRTPLFTHTDREPDPKTGAAQWRSNPTVIRSRFVELDPTVFATTATLHLNLFDDVAFTAVLEERIVDYPYTGGTQTIDHGNGITEVVKAPNKNHFWKGHIEGIDYSEVTFVYSNESAHGTIRPKPGVLYGVEYAGNGIYAVQELDPSKFPPD